MAFPPRPSYKQRPWYTTRETYDQSLESAIGRLNDRVVSWADYPLTAAGFAQAVAVADVGGTVYIPRGPASSPYDYGNIDETLVARDVHILSDGVTLTPNSDFGSGEGVIVFDSPSGDLDEATCQGINLRGPSATRTLGVSPCNMSGAVITNNAKVLFRDASAEYFRNGFDMDNLLGHIWFDHVVATNNYYGGYVRNNTSDYKLIFSTFNGNTFAGLATPADEGIDGLLILGSHLGFQPYGIYGESTPINQGNSLFIGDAKLYDARFEAIGNGAIVSEAQQDGSNRSSYGNVRITQPGFSWDAAYKIAAKNKDYAVDLGFTQGFNHIDSGANPFLPGDVGTVHIEFGNHSEFSVQANLGSIDLADYVVDANVPMVVYEQTPVGAIQRVESGTNGVSRIPAGSSTTELQWGSNANRIQALSYAAFYDHPLVAWRDSGGGYATIAELSSLGFWANAIRTGGSAGPTWTTSAATPEGAITAPVGSLHTRTDTGALYRKTSGAGNTGWVTP